MADGPTAFKRAKTASRTASALMSEASGRNAAGSKPSKLDLSGRPILAGEVSDKFVEANPFEFLAH
jgi:hypothetical protein